ncbi:hypothetical protein JL107_16835 [Nakamurella flavida]|uniref:Uncharacterized protein n=1 Tax=Nakamurella flavida TaxID=363630 RepID=A0A938YI45_9ACTN|nr:DLW-39 family protein [Nakamurella flavida]MBM9478116.1 hypothetical protein [Nakamurella flavida]MDP9778663.1 hypothetical protein [Nakamurella flavida]
MKKALLLIAIGAGGVLLMQKRKREAAAEAALWEEATKAVPTVKPDDLPTTTAGPAV